MSSLSQYSHFAIHFVSLSLSLVAFDIKDNETYNNCNINDDRVCSLLNTPN